MQQTQGWWHNKTQKHGDRKGQILTVGNVEVTLKLPYVVERQNQPNKNKQSLHERFCAFLRWLGMSEGLTPGVYYQRLLNMVQLVVLLKLHVQH